MSKITYPLTIQGIKTEKLEPWNISFAPVKVWICGDEKTYFGIYLGCFPWQLCAGYNPNDGMLTVDAIDNACILLPLQRRTVYGAECWWSRIDPDEDLSDITGAEIDGQWYAQLAKALTDVEERADRAEIRSKQTDGNGEKQ